MPNTNLKIKHLTIPNLWGKYRIDWELDPNVNILIGPNGCGKSTILDFLHDGSKTYEREYEAIIELENGSKTPKRDEVFPELLYSDFEATLLRTFDAKSHDSEKQDLDYSLLDTQLEDLFYGKGHNPSYIKYDNIIKSQVIDLLDQGKKTEADELRKDQHIFMDMVNQLFAESEKKIQFDVQKNVYFEDKENYRISLSMLSSGEKQMLIILLTVLLAPAKPLVLLLDEPELSLHLNWQFSLIENIRKLRNNDCQIIIATHAPAVFGEGWQDKIVRIEDIRKEI